MNKFQLAYRIRSSDQLVLIGEMTINLEQCFTPYIKLVNLLRNNGFDVLVPGDHDSNVRKVEA